MGIDKWENAPFTITVDCNERVLRKDLPILIGRSASLDKQIHKLLQTEDFQFGWLCSEQIVVLPEHKEGTDFIEIEVHGTSSGYFDSGSWDYPPESDEEKEINSANIYYYDKEGNQIHECETHKADFLFNMRRFV